MSVQRLDNLLLVDSGLASDMFNIVCCTGPIERDGVREVVEGYGERALPWCWWVGFDGEPIWLTEELERNGLIQSEEELAMSVELNSPPECPTISVRSMSSVEEVIALFAEGLPALEMESVSEFYRRAASLLSSSESPILFLIGAIDEKPAALSSLYLGEDEASIFDVMVTPRARGRGLGKAMTGAAMTLIATLFGAGKNG